MPLEDYTTYEEVDPNEHIEKTANHIDHYCVRNEDAYVYKDKGVGHFGDFEHLVQAKAVSGVLEGRAYFWVLADAVDDESGLHDKCIEVYFYYDDTNIHITLREWYNNAAYSHDWAGGSLDTWYYFTITKSGTSLTCKIYSDADRTNLLATRSLTLQADHTFRYIYACNTLDTIGSYQWIDTDIENLDLQEVPPPVVGGVHQPYLVLTLP